MGWGCPFNKPSLFSWGGFRFVSFPAWGVYAWGYVGGEGGWGGVGREENEMKWDEIFRLIEFFFFFFSIET